MRKFALASLAVTLAACAPVRTNQIAMKPSPVVTATCDAAPPTFIVDGVVQTAACAEPAAPSAGRLTGDCPIYIVDGVEQPSTCAAPKKVEASKCDATGPLYIVDGVIQSAPCRKPD